MATMKPKWPAFYCFNLSPASRVTEASKSIMFSACLSIGARLQSVSKNKKAFTVVLRLVKQPAGMVPV